MKTLRKLLLLGLPLVLSVLPATAQVNTGSADFSRYVALGASLTAGFSSGSLHAEGQALSYPSLIHSQATGSAAGFEQPLMADPGIPNILQLQSLAPLVIAPKPGQGIPVNIALERPYNNLAVPGANTGDIVRTTTGGLHPLVLRGLGTQLEQAAFLQPTFATLWPGGNDALGAVVSGIVIDGVTLTPTADVAADLAVIGETLEAVGTENGALATVPDVTKIPYVTTLPPVVVDPVTNEPVIVDGQLVPLIGPDGPLGLDDSVLLSATTELAQGRGVPVALGGSGQPLSDGAVLSASEKSAIQVRVAEYNALIRSAVQDSGVALADVAAVFEDISQNGVVLGGIQFTTEFLVGGLFSYDGIHPSPLGAALVANSFIEAINTTYGGEIPLLDLGPFVLGDLGRLPGTGTGQVPVAAGQLVFTKQAYRNLRKSLGIPSPRKLQRIKRRRERRGVPLIAAASPRVDSGSRVVVQRKVAPNRVMERRRLKVRKIRQ
jgi:hypothetical protein